MGHRARRSVLRYGQPAHGQESDFAESSTSAIALWALKATVIFADQLDVHRLRVLHSIGCFDWRERLCIPDAKADLFDRADGEVAEIEQQYRAGLVTQGEKYNKVIDIWSRTNDQVSKVHDGGPLQRDRE